MVFKNRFTKLLTYHPVKVEIKFKMGDKFNQLKSVNPTNEIHAFGIEFYTLTKLLFYKFGCGYFTIDIQFYEVNS